MLDLHCHILPGVDDGSHSLGESIRMLHAAYKAGVTEIVCTPHCRDPYFNYDAMWDAFESLKARSSIPLHMGFEVNIRKLREFGLEAALGLRFDGSNVLLLELSTHAGKHEFIEYEREIYELQGLGCEVVIAHPERYRAIQEDINIARNLVRMGCKLQASADFIKGGRFGKERRPAQKLFEEGLYSFLASDAHCVEHYEVFSAAWEKYSGMLRGDG